jgi:hypothetical protein
MIQLVFFSSVGLLLFVFLLALARRGKAEGGAEALVCARQALLTLRTELLDQELVARIFARDDLAFVRSQHSRAIESMFLRERKKIALIWLERIRSQIQLLRRLHLGSARFYARLELKTEISLGWSFATLLVTCRALRLAFWVAGPYAAPGMVSAVAHAATNVCEISRQSLAFLSGAGLDSFGNASRGGLPPSSAS